MCAYFIICVFVITDKYSVRLPVMRLPCSSMDRYSRGDPLLEKKTTGDLLGPVGSRG